MLRTPIKKIRELRDNQSVESADFSFWLRNILKSDTFLAQTLDSRAFALMFRLERPALAFSAT